MVHYNVCSCLFDIKVWMLRSISFNFCYPVEIGDLAVYLKMNFFFSISSCGQSVNRLFVKAYWSTSYISTDGLLKTTNVHCSALFSNNVLKTERRIRALCDLLVTQDRAYWST